MRSSSLHFPRIRKSPLSMYIAGAFGAVLLVVFVAVYILTVPTWGFPTNTVITIEEGATMRDAAHLLDSQGVVSSAVLLQSVVVFSGLEGNVFAGDYIFAEPKSILEIARAITTGEYGIPAVKLTIPEGFTIAQIHESVEEALGEEIAAEFLNVASSSEGYLFPDTYFFSPNVTGKMIFDTMRENFDQKIATIQEKIDAYGRPLGEVVIMASMLEKEANTTESRQIISGILWRRLVIDMPLQVDAVFQYYLGRNTFELTMADLASDSPYNTYRNKGLPPTPIGNPSLDSLEAAVTPTSSEYLYYLSDMDGEFHFAHTFTEHKRNRAQYLD